MAEPLTSRVGGVAIIGFSCRVPGASTADGFWNNLENGVESIRRFTREDLIASGVDPRQAAHSDYVPAKGVLDHADCFDAALFGYAPREASLMDPQHRVMLECAWEAMEHGGYGAPRPGARVAVYAGVALNTYLLRNIFAHRDMLATEGEHQILVSNDKDFVPTRISYQLNFAGPSINVQTACSTSLVAVHLAAQSLLTHQCDMALAGGAAVTVPLRHGYLYREGGILSADGRCRPFDIDAAGTVPGNGAGVVLLKRLEDAIEDGDLIHAVIAGSAVNNDGADKVGFTAPSIAGQAAVIAQAHAMADVRADSIGYVEAHGTGTPLGDPIEVAALTSVFRRTATERGYCGLGSVKGNIGHLDTAAGVVGLIKAVLAVRTGVIPPSLHFERPNPALSLDTSPFYVPTTAQAWRVAGPRRAGVSSFGIGGTNAHVVIEQAPARVSTSACSRRPSILCVSARTPQSLDEACKRLSGVLDGGEVRLADVAFTLARGRRAFAQRRAVVADARAQAAVRLIHPSPAVPFIDGRTSVWLFPGQGAQQIGMGEAIAGQEPEFDRALAEAAGALLRCGLPDVRELIWPTQRGGEAGAHLTATANAQAAIFAVEHAFARLWSSWGVEPVAVLGHSVGEFAAAVAAGVMSLEDAARLVAARGRLMQALPAGAMLSVALAESEVGRWLRPGIWLSAVNAPDACVLGGALGDIAELEQELGGRGVAARRLQTSHAFHTEMMAPMLSAFRAELAGVTLRAPEIPWVSSLSGTWMLKDAAVDPEYWVRQIREPVRFAAAIDTVLQSGDPVLLEMGPGSTLTTLARRGAPPAMVAVSSGARPGQDETVALAQAVATVWAAGMPVDWLRYYAGQGGRREALPTYPFERSRFWIDPPRESEQVTTSAGAGARLYRPTWRVASGPGRRPVTGRWLLFADLHGVGDALAACLEQSGATVRTVPATGCADVETCAGWLQEMRPDHVVHLGSLTAGAVPAESEVIECAYVSVLNLSRALVRYAATHAGEIALTVVSDAVHAVTERDAVCAAKSLLLGPILVLSQEHPAIACRLVDVEVGRASEACAAQLLAECLADCEDAVVAHRGRHRWVRAFQAINDVDPAPPMLRAQGVYVITGGLGAVGLTIARHLHQTTDARLVLIGRREVPAAHEWPALVEDDDDFATFEIGDEAAMELAELPAALDVATIGAIDASLTTQPHTQAREAEAVLAGTLDRYCTALLCAYFERGGIRIERGARYTMASLAVSLGVAGEYARFLEFMVGVLAEAGVLRREGDDVTVATLPPDADVAELHARAVAEHAAFAPVFDLLRTCGAHYDEILRRSVTGVSVLYPNGDPSAVEAAVNAMAGRSRHARYGRVLGQLLRDAAEGRSKPLRVLEIGGGNRFLTREVVPALAGVAVEYWFTDVSRVFVDAAQAWAEAAGHSELRFGVLDISRDPRAQGWSFGFDAVIGLDVVHATPDVEVTLRQVHALLAPGGSVHLIETLPPARWNTMVWGVAADWWRYSDRFRTTSPLLSTDSWTQALAAAGFDAAGAYPSDASQDCAIVFGRRTARDGTRDDTRDDNGAQVLAIQADVTDADQMAAAVACARKHFGAINGVIHAAGLETSGALALQDANAASPGLSAKVSGTRVLETVLRGEPLDFLMLCSSVTSLLGGVGNVEYAAANAFLDAVAHEREPRGYPVVSVNWDRWRGLGMAAVIEARHLARIGEPMGGGLAVDDALACFDAIAAAPRVPQIVVAPAGFEVDWRGAARVSVTALASQIVPVARHPRPFMATAFVAPDGDLEQQLASIWQDTLGVDEIGVDDDFMELGGDSLIAIKVASRLREALGLELPVATLFEAPTVARLAKHVEALRWASAPVAPAVEGTEEGEL